MKSGLINLTAVLSIFCFMQILPLEAEVQPFGAVVAAIFLARYRTVLGPAVGLYFAALGAGLAFSLARYALAGQPEPAAALTTFFAIGAPVLIFGAVFQQTHHLSPRVVLACIAAWLTVGISQTFLPQLQSALGLERLLTKFISRYAEEALTELDRGACLLAPEPSYAAHIVFLFLIAILYFQRLGKLNWPGTAFGLASVAVLAYVNRSGTLAMVVFAFVCTYCVLHLTRERNLKSLGMLTAAAAAPIAVLFFVSRQAAEEFRAAVVLMAFLEDFWRGQFDVVTFTTGFGSVRTVSVLTAAHSVLTGHYLGAGLGSWSYRFVDQLFAMGVNPWELFFFYSKGALVDIKPYSHVAILTFDLGIAGLVLDVALLYKAFKASGAMGRLLHDPLAASIVFVSIIAIVGNTLVSLPAYWIILALGLDLARRGALPQAERDRHVVR